MAKNTKTGKNDKLYAVGGATKLTGSIKKTCIGCGIVLYYHDKWDWTKYTAICHDCVMEKTTLTSKNMQFTKNGEKYAKQLTGLNDKQLKEQQKEFIRVMIAEQELRREIKKLSTVAA